MRKSIIVFAIVIAVSIYGFFTNDPDLIGSALQRPESGNHSLQNAYNNRQSDIQIKGSGVVIKLLRDDLEGSRHQRFILKITPSQTLLVAHNIDLAPKITSLKKGDSVGFNGEYEWNSKGGILHWTHHDPRGRHVDGWLKHNGRTYQ